MKTNIKLHQHYDSYPKQLGYWALWFIITALLVVLVSTVVNATETIYDLERDRSIYRDPHFTNCDDKFNNVGIEKSEFFVLHLGNVDDYILTDEVLDQWLDYEKYLKARHYDEEGEYKGLCASKSQFKYTDDYDGPIQKLSDYQDAEDESFNIPTQVIKIQGEDNAAFEDCREQRDRYEKERDECEYDYAELLDVQQILQINVSKCSSERIRLQLNSINQSCPDIEPVRIYKNELYCASILCLLILTGGVLGCKYSYKRGIKDYKKSVWEGERKTKR